MHFIYLYSDLYDAAHKNISRSFCASGPVNRGKFWYVRVRCTLCVYERFDPAPAATVHVINVEFMLVIEHATPLIITDVGVITEDALQVTKLGGGTELSSSIGMYYLYNINLQHTTRNRKFYIIISPVYHNV